MCKVIKEEDKFDLTSLKDGCQDLGAWKGRENIPGRVVDVRNNGTSFISLLEKSSIIILCILFSHTSVLQ